MSILPVSRHLPEALLVRAEPLGLKRVVAIQDGRSFWYLTREQFVAISGREAGDVVLPIKALLIMPPSLLPDPKEVVALKGCVCASDIMKRALMSIEKTVRSKCNIACFLAGTFLIPLYPKLVADFVAQQVAYLARITPSESEEDLISMLRTFDVPTYNRGEMRPVFIVHVYDDSNPNHRAALRNYTAHFKRDELFGPSFIIEGDVSFFPNLQYHALDCTECSGFPVEDGRVFFTYKQLRFIGTRNPIMTEFLTEFVEGIVRRRRVATAEAARLFVARPDLDPGELRERRSDPTYSFIPTIPIENYHCEPLEREFVRIDALVKRYLNGGPIQRTVTVGQGVVQEERARDHISRVWPACIQFARTHPKHKERKLLSAILIDTYDKQSREKLWEATFVDVEDIAQYKNFLAYDESRVGQKFGVAGCSKMRQCGLCPYSDPRGCTADFEAKLQRPFNEALRSPADYIRMALSK